jgi:hypothetical protein
MLLNLPVEQLYHSRNFCEKKFKYITLEENNILWLLNIGEIDENSRLNIYVLSSYIFYELFYCQSAF